MQPYLIKSLNKIEFELYLTVALIIILKIIFHEVSERYQISLLIFILLVKLFFYLICAKNLVIWKIKYWKYHKNSSLLQKIMKSKKKLL